jgi:hypothetical protein
MAVVSILRKWTCELSNYEEGVGYGSDVAYPIDDILDYEYDEVESKERILCKFGSIGEKSWPDPYWVNASCVSAPALKKKVEGIRNEVLKDAGVYRRSTRRPYNIDKFVFSDSKSKATKDLIN